jgi:glycosyltransferase involved in cell wall biosynthesis
MSEATPLVTVLFPVCNGGTYLRESLDSIFAQTFGDFELLIIDDGSTDNTPEILRGIRDPRLRVVTHTQNLGLVATLNEGLAIGRGEFVARQDHDDISHPERLQKQVDFLRAHPEHVLVGTEAIQMDARGRKAFRLLRPEDTESIRWYLCFENAFIHSSVMYRRETVRRDFDGYATPCFPAEDYALWSRLAREREMANLTEPLLLYREHVASAWGSLSAQRIAAMDEVTYTIRMENLKALVGEEYSSHHEQMLMSCARIFTAYHRNLSVESTEAFLAAFQRIFDIKLRPEKSANGKLPREYQRVLAIQYAELAYRLLPLARWKALGLFRRAFGWYPEIASMLPWPRIAALFLLGNNARKIFLAITGGR